MESSKLGGGLMQSAIQAALERHQSATQVMRDRMGGLSGAEETQPQGPRFAETLMEGIRSADQKVRDVEKLPLRVLEGGMELHEAAAQIQSSRIAFEFTMEVRNKFIDAYREVMRMSV